MSALSVTKVKFISCDIRLSDFSSMHGTLCTFFKSKFFKTNMHSLNIQDVSMQSTILVECDLSKAKFSDTNFKDANLSYTIDATGATFRNASFVCTVFEDNRFTGVDFTSAIFEYTLSKRNEISHCDFSSCTLTYVVFERTNFDDCFFSKSRNNNCIFQHGTFKNCKCDDQTSSSEWLFYDVLIEDTTFCHSKLSNIEICHSILKNVTFKDTDLVNMRMKNTQTINVVHLLNVIREDDDNFLQSIFDTSMDPTTFDAVEQQIKEDIQKIEEETNVYEIQQRETEKKIRNMKYY
jgi:uncharacterized protein YjbI with pentapeptide repeats